MELRGFCCCCSPGSSFRLSVYCCTVYRRFMENVRKTQAKLDRNLVLGLGLELGFGFRF